MPVCIAGMHRSGTSMIARLLNLCGLYLGPEDELIPPSANNPQGFWEHRHLMKLNEEILDQLGLAWDVPFSAPMGWETRPEIVALQRQARKLVEPLRCSANWGWKDPRNSLTLPFWKALFPDLRVVMCLRNPAEVAASLHRRGSSSSRFSHGLWLSYYRQLIATTSPGERIVTHYDSFFIDARQELRRVLASLGIEASDDTIERACEAVAGRLRHSVADQDVGVSVPPEIMDLYTQLCAQAGIVYEAASTLQHRGAHGGAAPIPTVSGDVAPVMRALEVADQPPVVASRADSTIDFSPFTEPISLAVVNWSEADGRSWQASVAAAGYPLDAMEIILPDDGERPAALENVRLGSASVSLVPVEKGLSLSEVANGVASRSQSEYLVLVDATLRLGEGWLRPLVAAMQSQPELAGAGALVLGRDGKVLASASARGDLFALMRWSRQWAEPASSTTDISGYTLSAPLGAALYRREALLSAGGFSAESAMPYDDTDLGWRLWLFGHRCARIPEALAYGSTPEIFSPARTWALTQKHALLDSLRYMEMGRLLGLLPVLLDAMLEQHRFLPGAHRALARIISQVLSSMDSLVARRAEVQAARVRTDGEIFALTGDPFARLRQLSANDAVRMNLAAYSPITPANAGDPLALRLAVAERLNAAHFRHESCLAAELAALTDSPGWVPVRMLHRTRLWLVPPGSGRERLWTLGLSGLGTWRREGFWSVVRKGSRLFSRPSR